MTKAKSVWEDASTDRNRKAWLAVTRFRSLVPTLSAFARALTKNPRTKVEIVKSGAYSDGDKIYLAPPISLGEEVDHNRSICSLRDGDKQLLCEGCQQQEDVMYRLFHEMGHIIYGSSERFDWMPTGGQLMMFAQETWENDFPWFSKKMPALKKKFEKGGHYCDTVLSLAYALHPYLKLFANAIEDLRVDSATHVARPGIKSMAEAQTWAIMANGVTEYNDKGELVIHKWSDRPVDMQILIGFLDRGFEYDMDHFISEEANKVLEDPILAELIVRARETVDQFQSFELACIVLHRLHQMGYCDPPVEDTEEEEKEDSKEQEQEKKEEQAEPEESDGESQPTKAELTEKILEELEKLLDCEGKRMVVVSKAEAEAVAVAVMQAIWFEGPSAEIAGVSFHHYRDRHNANLGEVLYEDGWTGYGDPRRIMTSEAILNRAVMHARLVFSDNKRTKVVRNKKSGRIAGGKLYRAALEDERLFAKRERPGRKDYFGVIMLDISGSNASGTIHLLREMAMAQGELLSRLGVPFEMYAHTGLPTKGYGRAGERRSMYLSLFPVVAQGEHWSSESRKRVAALEASCANLDGHALEFARKRCDAVRATDHFILYSSDGMMPCENYEEELEILRREIKTCKQKGYTLQGVGLRTDAPKRHGLDTVIVESSSDIGLVVKQLEKRLA